METYTISINEKTKLGKYIIGFLKEMKDVVTIQKVTTSSPTKRKTGLDEALEDVKNGNINKYTSVDELINACS